MDDKYAKEDVADNGEDDFPEANLGDWAGDATEGEEDDAESV